MDERPPQPPEGKIIADALERSGLSIREASRRANISYGRWRQITSGVQNASPGSWAAVRGPARTVARMAAVVGVTADEMAGAGREDVAEVLREERRPLSAVPASGDPEFENSIAVIRGLPLPEDVRNGMIALARGMRQQGNGEANGSRRQA